MRVAPSATLSSISVAMGPASWPAGQPQRIQMIATGRFLDTDRDLTSVAEWQNSNPDVGTISTTGLLTQTGPGTTTITATYQGKSGSLSFATTYPLPGPWDY
jgi:large repetitive protein